MFLPRLSPTATWGGVFVVYAGTSLLWSGNWWAGLELASLVLAFGLGAVVRDLRNSWIVVILIFCISLLTIPWLPWGLFGNPNYFGCACALALAGALVYRQWYSLPFLGFGLLYSGSRGAILAAGAACVIYLWSIRWLRFVAIAVGAAFLAAALFASAGRDNSLLARAGIWQDTIMNATVLGSGWGSFYEMYWHFPIHVSPTEHMTGVRAAHAYSDFLELTFELGIGVIPLWIFLLNILERPAPERLICWTFFILALTFFPLHVVPVGHLFALTLGNLSRQSLGEHPWLATTSKTSTI